MQADTTTITLENLDRLPPEAAETLGAILKCYNAYFVAIRHGVLSIVLPDEMVDSLLMTMQRDVLPVEIVFGK